MATIWVERLRSPSQSILRQDSPSKAEDDPMVDSIDYINNDRQLLGGFVEEDQDQTTAFNESNMHDFVH